MKKILLIAYCLLFCVVTNKIHSQTITWSETTPTGTAENKDWGTTSISSDGSILIAGVNPGRLYISANSGSSWTETQPTGGAVDKSWLATSMSSDGSKLIAGVNWGRLYKSINSGSSWTETQPGGVADKRWYTTSMSADGSKLIAGAYGDRLYISNNSGGAWSETTPTGTAENKDWCTTSMSSDGNILLAGIYGGRLFISVNGGSSWTETQPAGAVDKNWRATSMSSDGSKIIAGVFGGRLYVSTNTGDTWAETRPTGIAEDKNWRTTSMNSDGSKLITGVNGGRLYINNEPLPVELTTFTASIANNKVTLYWQTATEVNNYGFEVEQITYQNSKWEKIGFVQGYGNSNSPKSYSFTDVPNDGTEFTYRLKQIDFDGKFEYSPEVIVNLEVPANFSVKQNFPNPFNPTTKIEFAIPSDNNVKIKVFNVLGMEVATLVNEHRQTGKYNVEFNASNLASGIYIYKIVSGKYSEIKKMILMR